MSSTDLPTRRHDSATQAHASAHYAAELGRPRLYTCAPGIQRISTLAALLNDFALQYRPKGLDGQGSVLAWGLRPSAQRAQRYAKKHGLGVYHIEDGFLRSVGLGQDSPPLSIVLDDLGLYLDAAQPSRLEALIKRPLISRRTERAQALIRAWCDGQVYQYNHSRDLYQSLPEQCVLVVDQTRGDASISGGQADERSFARMLKSALDEHPGSTILLKTSPDVVAGRKQGHFDLAAARAMPRVKVLDADVHPASLLFRVQQVYTVTSQLGFEALLWGVPVRVFGMPFYAGWGLTKDDMPMPLRRGPVPLEQLVHATLIDYSRYVDPETGKRCEVETLLAWLALQRRMRQRFDTQVDAVGFTGWKKRHARAFFQGSGVSFQRRARVTNNHAVAVWGNTQDASLGRKPIVRISDGFLRSVGLGADRTRPLSWVQDELGIYYDATRPSRLEELLLHTEFSAELIARATLLRHAICAAGLTKYNLPGPRGLPRPNGQHVILVPGQVEDDASVQFGASNIRSNMGLLRAVREDNPDAYIFYKPHPDVVSGLRRAGQDEERAAAWCDEIVGQVPIQHLLDIVDEVHVLTSLTGFEALLRKVPVVTYGQPFYAGWGLTHDTDLSQSLRRRRTRVLDLDELVAGALILYPTYVSRVTGQFTTPERVLRELIEWRAKPGVPRWRHWLARLFRERT